MADLPQDIRDHITSDHVRGCMGRQYSCDCGYDLKTEGLLELAAAEIEQLHAALEPFCEAAWYSRGNGNYEGQVSGTALTKAKAAMNIHERGGSDG